MTTVQPLLTLALMNESVNSLIVGVFGGFTFCISVSPQTRRVSSLCSRMHILKIPIPFQGEDRMFQPRGRPLGYLAVAVISLYFFLVKFPLCSAWRDLSWRSELSCACSRQVALFSFPVLQQADQ